MNTNGLGLSPNHSMVNTKYISTPMKNLGRFGVEGNIDVVVAWLQIEISHLRKDNLTFIDTYFCQKLNLF